MTDTAVYTIKKEELENGKNAKWAASFREGIMMRMVYRVGFEEWSSRMVNLAGRPFQAEARA